VRAESGSRRAACVATWIEKEKEGKDEGQMEEKGRREEERGDSDEEKEDRNTRTGRWMPRARVNPGRV